MGCPIHAELPKMAQLIAPYNDAYLAENVVIGHMGHDSTILATVEMSATAKAPTVSNLRVVLTSTLPPMLVSEVFVAPPRAYRIGHPVHTEEVVVGADTLLLKVFYCHHARTEYTRVAKDIPVNVRDQTTYTRELIHDRVIHVMAEDKVALDALRAKFMAQTAADAADPAAAAERNAARAIAARARYLELYPNACHV